MRKKAEFKLTSIILKFRSHREQLLHKLVSSLMVRQSLLFQFKYINHAI